MAFILFTSQNDVIHYRKRLETSSILWDFWDENKTAVAIDQSQV